MVKKYPVFVLCGRDEKKREILETLDPNDEYKVKCLLPFLGKRIIDWQLEALRESPYCGELILLGLSEELAKFDYPVHYVPIPLTATFGQKLLAGLDYARSIGIEDKVFVTSSSDTPGITVEPINEFFEFVENHYEYDFIQSVVPDDVTKEVFEDHQRVVAKFKDIHIYPGEMFSMSEKGIRTGQAIIDETGRGRRRIKKQNREKKNSALKPILRIVLRKPRTWPLIISFLIGRMPIHKGERLLEIISDCTVKSAVINDAGFGMDIDLSEDYDKLKQYVSETKNVPYTEGLS
jgi:hypothetical protein